MTTHKKEGTTMTNKAKARTRIRTTPIYDAIREELSFDPKKLAVLPGIESRKRAHDRWLGTVSAKIASTSRERDNR